MIILSCVLLGTVFVCFNFKTAHTVIYILFILIFKYYYTFKFVLSRVILFGHTYYTR